VNQVEKAGKDFQKKEDSLTRLREDKDKLSQAIDALRGERAAAVRSLAAGDESKRKTIMSLEGKLSPLLQKMEGLEILVRESEAEEEKAREALRVAEAEVKARLSEYLRDRTTEYFEKQAAGLPGKVDEIVKDYAALCENLAELQVAGLIVTEGGEVRRSPELEKILAFLPDRLFEAVRRGNLKRSLLRGHAGSLEVFPLFSPNGEGVPDGPPGMVVDPGPVALVRHQRRLAEWSLEFQEKEK
jgi:hypothetical protein